LRWRLRNGNLGEQGIRFPDITSGASCWYDGLGGFFAGFFGGIEDGFFAVDDIGVDDVVAVRFFVGEFVHNFEHNFFGDGAEGAGAGVSFEGFFDDGGEAFGGKFELGAFHFEEFAVLADQGVFGFGEDFDEGFFVEGFQGGGDGQSSDEFGDHADFDQVVGGDLEEDLGYLVGRFVGGLLFGGEADHFFAETFFDDVFESGEGAAADEEDLGGVHLYVLLFGVFAASLGGDVGDGAFEELEERLLDAFAGDVAGDGDILVCFADFVEFVDIDDALLGGFDVVFGGLEESE